MENTFCVRSSFNHKINFYKFFFPWHSDKIVTKMWSSKWSCFSLSHILITFWWQCDENESRRNNIMITISSICHEIVMKTWNQEKVYCKLNFLYSLTFQALKLLFQLRNIFLVHFMFLNDSEKFWYSRLILNCCRFLKIIQ